MTYSFHHRYNTGKTFSALSGFWYAFRKKWHGFQRTHGIPTLLVPHIFSQYLSQRTWISEQFQHIWIMILLSCTTLPSPSPNPSPHLPVFQIISQVVRQKFVLCSVLQTSESLLAQREIFLTSYGIFLLVLWLLLHLSIMIPFINKVSQGKNCCTFIQHVPV